MWAGRDGGAGVTRQVLKACAETYCERNLLIVYDAISTVCESVGNEIAKPEYLPYILPPIIDKWNKTPDGDRNLIPILECMTSVIAVGGGRCTGVSHLRAGPGPNVCALCRRCT